MKKQTKKLTLNKKTISNLNPSEMGQLIGAGHSATCKCHGHTFNNGCGDGGNSQNCTQNQNTCPGHNTCYNC